jgi:membrane-associated phospholipid phosphatase
MSSIPVQTADRSWPARRASSEFSHVGFLVAETVLLALLLVLTFLVKHILSKIANFYSFPSGHVVHATAVFGLFLFLSTQIRRPIHPLVIGLIRVLLVAAIILMPISRILEGEHWPTDVLAGLLYGGFWLVIAAHVYVWARKRWPRLLARDER